jgi:hypothetical protein
MKFTELATNPDFLMRMLFIGGVWLLFVMLLPHEPLIAGLGFLMVGMPALHWYLASKSSQKLGRYRGPLLAAVYVGMWAGILIGIGWAGQSLIAAFRS